MEKTWKPTVAGILAIINGVSVMIMGLVVAFGNYIPPFPGMEWFGAMGAPFIVLGIIAIIGGICALLRKIWGLALAGTICALSGLAGILAIPAIIFVILGKGEFK
jgi:peptidoglycan/LPS O-acetylase OafA/YrhL